MTEFYRDDNVVIFNDDSTTLLATLPDNYVDAIVTDPPYGLSKEPNIAEVLTHWLAGDDYKHRGGGFMGKSWDSFVPGPVLWSECLRVLKPGGHLLCFAGSRTMDLMGVSLRIAGFEIRDSLQWLYGSGFPKSLDVSKAIDKAAGVNPKNRPVIGVKLGAERLLNSTVDGKRDNNGTWGNESGRDAMLRGPVTPDAERWQGWGTALKPAVEPICLARKPLVGTVAANVLEHGTGALNIDGCRVGAGGHLKWSQPRNMGYHGGTDSDAVATPADLGRWPANVLLDEDAAAMLDEQSGWSKTPSTVTRGAGGQHGAYSPIGRQEDVPCYGDSGDASRFFYVAKAGKKERPELPDGTKHPTVKPIKLMRYLVRLVTPPGGIVLDPFLGSGTTAEACVAEGFKCIGVEMSEDYARLAVQRLNRDE